MTIVIDVGCAKHGGDESIPYLIEEFAPAMLAGFDPAEESRVYTFEDTDTTVVIVQAAAWTHDGKVTFEGDGLRGHVTGLGTRLARQVECVDLARYVLELTDDDVILKMDAEGAEYVLLPALIAQDADLALRLVWIEWHCPACGTGWFGNETPDTCARCGYAEPGKRTELEQALRCEVAQWNR